MWYTYCMYLLYTRALSGRQVRVAFGSSSSSSSLLMRTFKFKDYGRLDTKIGQLLT